MGEVLEPIWTPGVDVGNSEGSSLQKGKDEDHLLGIKVD